MILILTSLKHFSESFKRHLVDRVKSSFQQYSGDCYIEDFSAGVRSALYLLHTFCHDWLSRIIIIFIIKGLSSSVFAVCFFLWNFFFCVIDSFFFLFILHRLHMLCFLHTSLVPLSHSTYARAGWRCTGTRYEIVCGWKILTLYRLWILTYHAPTHYDELFPREIIVFIRILEIK